MYRYLMQFHSSSPRLKENGKEGSSEVVSEKRKNHFFSYSSSLLIHPYFIKYTL